MRGGAIFAVVWPTSASVVSASGAALTRESTALAGKGVEELRGQTALTEPSRAQACPGIELLPVWADQDRALALAGRGVLHLGTDAKLGALALAGARIQHLGIEAERSAPTWALGTPHSAEGLVKVGRKSFPA